MAEPRDPREPRIPKETAPFDADNKWTRTWIMYFESLFTLSVKEAVRQAGTVTHTSGDLTKDLPVFGNDKADVKVGTKSGNTNEVATVAGAVVTGNTVKWDASGNLIDAGTAPGGGGSGTVTHTGGALTADQPVFGAGSADIKVGTKSGNTNKVVTNTGTNVTGNTVKWDASGNLIDAGTVPGGGSGTPGYISSLIAGPDTTRTITGATHGYATAGLLVQVYDNASPRNAIAAGWTVNSSTFDVIVTFASAQSNYYIVINGATGPAGPTGPPGSGSGTVTSVALTVPAEFSVSGSPVTTSGTLAVTKATQTANTVYAGPTTGSAAAPTFRAVVPADLPLASSSAFGACKVDGTTITASSGVISAAGGGGSSGALVLLESHTASSSATLDFTTRNASGQSGATFASDYEQYVIEIVNVTPATNTATLQLRFSTNGGSSFDSGSNYSGSWGWLNSAAQGQSSSGTTSHLISDATSSTASNGGVCGTYTVYSPSSASIHKLMRGVVAFFNPSGFMEEYRLVCRYTVTTAVNAFQVYFNAGNLTSGIVRVYGIAK